MFNTPKASETLEFRRILTRWVKENRFPEHTEVLKVLLPKIRENDVDPESMTSLGYFREDLARLSKEAKEADNNEIPKVISWIDLLTYVPDGETLEENTVELRKHLQKFIKENRFPDFTESMTKMVKNLEDHCLEMEDRLEMEYLQEHLSEFLQESAKTESPNIPKDLKDSVQTVIQELEFFVEIPDLNLLNDTTEEQESGIITEAPQG